MFHFKCLVGIQIFPRLEIEHYEVSDASNLTCKCNAASVVLYIFRLVIKFTYPIPSSYRSQNEGVEKNLLWYLTKAFACTSIETYVGNFTYIFLQAECQNMKFFDKLKTKSHSNFCSKIVPNSASYIAQYWLMPSIEKKWKSTTLTISVCVNKVIWFLFNILYGNTSNISFNVFLK